MNGKKVIVTYCDEFGVWPLVANDLSSRLPLKNLQWQPSSQRAERFIPSLEVDLQRFSFEHTPHSLLSTQTTYLNLYFVSCDDNEQYKNKVKKQIRNWVDLIMSKKNQEWMIVYVAGQDVRRTNYLGLKTSVFDKIRADFNQGKRDRCAYIRIQDPDGASSEAWFSFIDKMKECILSSFDMQVQQIQEDARRLDMQRHMPGWNYCTFFILKEGLAQAFEVMTLYEDALIQYDELEASFFQVLRDKALAWFGHFGATDPGDDSGNILDFKRKDYRDLINKNVISVFDFRCYLFARQYRMLLKMQRLVDACARAQLFVSSFIPSIVENKDVLVDNFVESWVFSACMNVVNECEPYSAQLATMDTSFLIPYNAIKADLLLTARRQLDKLGVKYGHLPKTTPFTIYLNGQETAAPTSPTAPKSTKTMTNQKLLEAIDSIESFDKMYMALSSRAIKSYDASYRPRAALTVHGDIASLKFTRDKLSEAVPIFESVIWRYDEQEWGFIENSMLIKCAEAQHRLQQTNQFVESLLTLLKNAKFLSPEDSERYTDELLVNVQHLDREIKRSFSPMFSVAVVSIIDDASTVESTSVEVCIDNHLPKTLHFDELTLLLVGNDPEQLCFSIENQDLHPGKNKFYLTSKVTTSGNYVVETCEMRIGKLYFGHMFLRPGQKKRVVRLNYDVNQLKVSVSQPDEVYLGESQRFAVRVSTGSDPITKGTVVLEPQTEGLEILKSSKVPASIIGGDGSITELEMLDTGAIVLPPCDANTVLEIFVAYEGSYTDIEYRIKIKASYETKDKQREFISSEIVKVTVPLVVTESSIFREKCVFLKVELSCNGDLPVRILGSTLQPSKFYALEDPSPTEQWDLTLFPKQVATFVYKLIKRDASQDDHDLKAKVHFFVKYRTLKEEVETSLGTMLKQKMQEHNLGQHFDYLFSRVKDAFLSSVDYVRYGLTDVVHLDDFDAELCETFLLNRDIKTKVELLDLVEEFFEKHEAITMQAIQEKIPSPCVHAISFPLDVPTSKILHTAELIISVDQDLLVAEACPCVLRIKRSSHWSDENTDTLSSSQDFYYDIDVDYDNWLLAGHRRLRFESKPNQVLEFPIDLVPLKTGNLLLPAVRVSAVSTDVFSATVYVNNAQQILVKPKSQTATFFIEQQQRFMQPQAVPQPFVGSPETVAS